MQIATLRSTSTSLNHALVVCDLTQILEEVFSMDVSCLSFFSAHS